MKKSIICMLAAITIFTMAGCNNNETKTSSVGEGQEASGEGTQSGKETLIVGTEAGFAPYEYMEGDKVVGIDMDIAQEIANSMGRTLEIKNMDFDGALLAVQQGKVDFVAAGVSVDEERKAVMDFSMNYVDSIEVIVVNQSAPRVSGTEGSDLNGKIVGVQQGNIADIWVSNKENCEPAEIKRYTKFAQAAEDLKNEKIDCIVMDQFPAQELVKASEGTLTILEGEPLFSDQYAIAVQKGNQELLDEINTVIHRLIDEGKIEEFTANHTAQ